MPYFLQGQVRHPIGIENEYARILGEQGVIGLLLWLGFMIWFLYHSPTAFAKGPWSTTRRLSWSITAIGFGTAWIGTGLLSSIPGTVMLMAVVGWTATPQTPEPSTIRENGLTQQAYRRAFGPAVSN
jgi:O-antigen ligase